ncbi:uncharacterized protein LOC141654826 [Silene latifolia]|uniref:uncharacterized protein LOC141654826 n=1 Tax=Silene latifolia TaxID=37657 RepID=UPI003D77753D
MRDVLALEDPEAKTKLFGGKVILLGGDFRQVLPIITKGKRQDIIQASINRSYIWYECQLFTLSKSMRVSETADNPQKQKINHAFNNWLLAMGDGRIETKAAENETEPTWIEIPKEYIGSNGPLSVETVVERIYPYFQQERFNETYLKERAILTSLNEMADKITTYMVGLIQSEEKIYRSCDEVCT